MKDQHSSIVEGAHGHDMIEENATLSAESTAVYDEDFGFIGVAMGEGFVNIFKDLASKAISLAAKPELKYRRFYERNRELSV